MAVLIPDNQYTCRINNALNYAQTNVNANLDSMADAACLSKFHFLRLFNAQIGVSPVSFLKRVRLERAACLLSYDHESSILDIGSRCGFSNSQHFARSFSDKFGRCPRDFRIFRRFDSKDNVDLLLQRFQAQGLIYDQQSPSDEIDIVKTPGIRVAYVRNIGDYYDSSGGIKGAIEFVTWWAKKHDLLTRDTKIIGVSWDYSSLTPNGMRRYDACIKIPDNFPFTPDISMQTLPGGFYATMRTTIEPVREKFFLKWKLFDLTLSTSPKFKRYKLDGNMGPWYEIFKPNISWEHPEIVFCSHLHPRTKTLKYS
ncbi:MAG: AraC family transcriptional regulator [Arenicella sp.]